MNFEGQYLTYSEYKLLGGELEIMPFNLLEFEARKIIDARTQNRLKGVEKTPQEVKMCINKIIVNLISYIKNETTAQGITSESVGSYSVSYLTNADMIQVIKSKNEELEDIMQNYLSNVAVNNIPVLYLGVC